MPWLYLFVAGLLEVVWVIGMKYADGWTKLGPSVFTLTGMLASFYCLAQAVRTIPLGTGYAIWTGIGAIGATIAAVYLFKEEAMTPARVACLIMVVGGIFGLKITSGH